MAFAVTKFKASDGLIFKNEADAINHEVVREAQRKLRTWPRTFITSDIGEPSYLIKTLEEAEEFAALWVTQNAEGVTYSEYHIDYSEDFFKQAGFPCIAFESSKQANRWQYDDGTLYSIVFIPVRIPIEEED